MKMAEIKLECGIKAHKAKVLKESNEIEYTDNLAEYFAKEYGSKPRPGLQNGEIYERGSFTGHLVVTGAIDLLSRGIFWDYMM